MPASSPAVGPARDDLVDLRDRRRPFGLDRQVDERPGRHGHAHRVALQLPLELRHDEAEGLGGARGGGDEVAGGRTRPAVVLVRPVEQLLIARIGVHGGHQAVADAQTLVQHLGDRREAIRGAGGVRDDVVRLGVVDVVKLTPSATVTSGFLAGAEMTTLRAPASRCLAASSRARKYAARKAARPVRPNPLMATRTVMIVSSRSGPSTLREARCIPIGGFPPRSRKVRNVATAAAGSPILPGQRRCTAACRRPE